jgi:ubiquinone/menaquinone biosynthesis C-methylase UbiE
LFEGLEDPQSLVVADIGAGTGISTALLAHRVREVLAVEPNASMRERATAIPNVRWIAGTAEATTLAGKSVDVAAAFQAFHWFDASAAFRELSRIARRRIGLVQYERDESQPFSAAYAAVIRPFMLDDTEALRLRTLDRFTELAGDRLRRRVIPSSQTLTLEGVLGRIASSSYLPQEGDAAAQLRANATAIFEAHATDGTVEMAMSMFVLTADVRD